jgi:hypothetical protein
MKHFTRSLRGGAALILLVSLPGTIAWADSITREVTLEAGAPLVRLLVEPSPGVAAYVVEEFLARDVVPMEIGDGGFHDVASSALKWGPFTDNAARVLSYRLTGPQGGTAVNALLTHADGGAASGPAIIQLPDPGSNFHGWRAGRLDREQLQTLASNPDTDLDGNGLSLLKEYAMGIGNDGVLPLPEIVLVPAGGNTYDLIALFNSKAADLQVFLEQFHTGGAWKALDLALLGISPVVEPLPGFEPAGRLVISGLNLGDLTALLRLRFVLPAGEP